MPSVMRRMNNIARCQAIYRGDAMEGDLSACDHSFVLAICRHPGSTQEQLAAMLCLNKSTVARRLGQLEEKGYLERRTDPRDRRAMLVYPTEKMMEVHPRVVEIAREWNRRLTEGIDESDMERFWELLSQMEARAKALVGNREDEE